MKKIKNTIDTLKIIHSFDSIAINKQKEEIERLKAEVERLTEGNECLDQMHEKEMARSAFLCEEVNRTTAWGRGLESDLSWARAELMQVKAEVDTWKLRSNNWQKFCGLTRPEMTDELNRLKAEVERLTKAVMHSPAAQLKLKELEGKTTYEEINPKKYENNS